MHEHTHIHRGEHFPKYFYVKESLKFWREKLSPFQNRKLKLRNSRGKLEAEMQVSYLLLLHTCIAHLDCWGFLNSN